MNASVNDKIPSPGKPMSRDHWTYASQVSQKLLGSKPMGVKQPILGMTLSHCCWVGRLMSHLSSLADMEVLDTAALLSWPVQMLINGLCATSQLSDVERLSPARHLLVEAQGPSFVDPTPSAIEMAMEASQETGDFAGLSKVDIDVLALALSTGHPLVTDDYRMQNVMQMAGLTTHSVGTTGAKQVWQWELRCTGCGATEAVPPSINSSKSGPVKECSSCGAAMMLKRKKQ